MTQRSFNNWGEIEWEFKWGGSSGVGETWSEFGYILNLDSRGLVDSLIRCREKRHLD